MKFSRLLFALAFPLFGLASAVYTGCGSSEDSYAGEDSRAFQAGGGYGYGYAKSSR